MIVHRQFFGDAERAFALPLPMLRELERTTGFGVYALNRRMISHDCGFDEIHSTIRLALVGGGTDPEEASALVKAYVEPRPLIEAWALALSIMEATMHGVEPAPEEEVA